jgi:transcriptional regulator with XRE-family HTH domain
MAAKKHKAAKTMNQGTFPKLLKRLRVEAGFSSLSAVVLAAKRAGTSGVVLSKAKLSQYERGTVETIRPEMFQLLAKLYHVSFDSLATAWFRDRYGVTGEALGQSQTITLPSSGQLRLEQGADAVTVTSLEEFQHQQGRLPKGAYVIVAVRRFLDDTVFFDMVSANIARGVRYIYLCPETHRSIYRHLITKLELAYPKRAGAIDGRLMRFFPRYDFDSPVNQVLYVVPSGEITGHIGLALDELPVLYQVTTERMALRMFHSLMAMIQISQDPSLMRALKRDEANVASSSASGSDRPLSVLKALL